METSPIEAMRRQTELLAVLSTLHLMPSTRTRLADDELSVNAYPAACGGFVYVGTPAYQVPAEPDLMTIFQIAERAGVAWLMFDREAAVIHGLPVFGVAGPGA
jgi:hypothetical protein